MPGPIAGRPARSRIPWSALLVGAVYAACVARILRLVDRHAVNVLFWDQVTLYEALRKGAGAWELFRWQHGPHRQGAGFWVTAWIAERTDWNTRVEAFAIAAGVCVAAALALALAARLSGRLRAGDAAIPLLVLTPAQYGVFIHTPNLSHGVGPLLLLLAFCLACALPRRASRYGALVLLDFLLIHTGFGVVAGAIAPVILALCAVRDGRELGVRGAALPALGAALSMAWIGVFLLDYDSGDVEQVGGSAAMPAYARYVALMFANVLGLKGGGTFAILGGALAASATAAIAVEQIARAARAPGPRELALLSLTSFSLLYAAATAYGRLALGFPGAQSTRYVPLLVPAFLAIYLRLRQIERPALRAVSGAAAALAMALATIPMRAPEARFMHRLSAGKRIWAEVYRATGSIEEADARAGLTIYPHEGPELPRMLDYMRAHRLNLFAEPPNR